MKTMILGAASAFALAMFVTGAFAQSASPVEEEYKAAMQKMNEEMMHASDPNPDNTFAKKMIAHHKGAIAMSQIALKHSKKPDVQKEAKKIVEESEKGIKALDAAMKGK